MDTLVFTFEELAISGIRVDSYNQITEITEAPGINNFGRGYDNYYFIPSVGGTVLPNGSETATEECARFTLDIGGIEWSVTAVHVDNSGNNPVETPYELSPRTYIDAYGKLHIGDEIQDGDKLTVTAKLVNRNPSGSGYELTSGNSIILVADFHSNSGLGNFNAAENVPYIAYQRGDSLTPASGRA